MPVSSINGAQPRSAAVPPHFKGVRDLVDLIEALIVGSTEQWLQIGAKCYRVLRADMGIERAHVPEDLDKLKVIGCRVLGDQGEGLHSGIVATILDERHEPAGVGLVRPSKFRACSDL